MDARDIGFGYIITMPRFFSSHLGKVVYIDNQGVVRSMGKLSDDVHFKMLVDESKSILEFTSTIEEHPSLTVALTTGCVEVKPLTEEEFSE